MSSWGSGFTRIPRNTGHVGSKTLLLRGHSYIPGVHVSERARSEGGVAAVTERA